jgi:hypothetical protein
MKWYMRGHKKKIDGNFHLFKEERPPKNFNEKLDRAEK